MEAPYLGGGDFIPGRPHEDDVQSFYRGVTYSYKIQSDGRHSYMLLRYQEQGKDPVFYDIHFSESNRNLLLGEAGKQMNPESLEILARKASHVVKTLVAANNNQYFESASLWGGQVKSFQADSNMNWEAVKGRKEVLSRKDGGTKTYEKKIENIYAKMKGCFINLHNFSPSQQVSDNPPFQHTQQPRPLRVNPNPPFDLNQNPPFNPLHPGFPRQYPEVPSQQNLPFQPFHNYHYPNVQQGMDPRIDMYRHQMQDMGFAMQNFQRGLQANENRLEECRNRLREVEEGIYQGDISVAQLRLEMEQLQKENADFHQAIQRDFGGRIFQVEQELRNAASVKNFQYLLGEIQRLENLIGQLQHGHQGFENRIQQLSADWENRFHQYMQGVEERLQQLAQMGEQNSSEANRLRSEFQVCQNMIQVFNKRLDDMNQMVNRFAEDFQAKLDLLKLSGDNEIVRLSNELKSFRQSLDVKIERKAIEIFRSFEQALRDEMLLRFRHMQEQLELWQATQENRTSQELSEMRQRMESLENLLNSMQSQGLISEQEVQRKLNLMESRWNSFLGEVRQANQKNQRDIERINQENLDRDSKIHQMRSEINGYEDIIQKIQIQGDNLVQRMDSKDEEFQQHVLAFRELQQEVRNLKDRRGMKPHEVQKALFDMEEQINKSLRDQVNLARFQFQEIMSEKEENMQEGLLRQQYEIAQLHMLYNNLKDKLSQLQQLGIDLHQANKDLGHLRNQIERRVKALEDWRDQADQRIEENRANIESMQKELQQLPNKIKSEFDQALIRRFSEQDVKVDSKIKTMGREVQETFIRQFEDRVLFLENQLEQVLKMNKRGEEQGELLLQLQQQVESLTKSIDTEVDKGLEKFNQKVLEIERDVRDFKIYFESRLTESETKTSKELVLLNSDLSEFQMDLQGKVDKEVFQDLELRLWEEVDKRFGLMMEEMNQFENMQFEGELHRKFQFSKMEREIERLKLLLGSMENKTDYLEEEVHQRLSMMDEKWQLLEDEFWRIDQKVSINKKEMRDNFLKQGEDIDEIRRRQIKDEEKRIARENNYDQSIDEMKRQQKKTDQKVGSNEARVIQLESQFEDLNYQLQQARAKGLTTEDLEQFLRQFELLRQDMGKIKQEISEQIMFHMKGIENDLIRVFQEEAARLKKQFQEDIRGRVDVKVYQEHLTDFEIFKRKVTFLEQKGSPLSLQAKQELDDVKNSVLQEANQKAIHLESQFNFLQKQQIQMQEGEKHRLLKMQKLQTSHQDLLKKVELLTSVDQDAISQVEKLRLQQEQMNLNIQLLISKVDKMSERMLEYEKYLFDIDQEVKGLKVRVKKEIIQELNESQLQDHTDRLHSLEEKVLQLKNQKASLSESAQQSLEKVQENLDEAKSDILQVFNFQVADFQDKFSKLFSEETDRLNQLEESRSRQRAVEIENLQNLQQQLLKKMDILSHLESRVRFQENLLNSLTDKMESEVTSLRGEIAENQKDIAFMHERMDGYDQDIQKIYKNAQELKGQLLKQIPKKLAKSHLNGYADQFKKLNEEFLQLQEEISQLKQQGAPLSKYAEERLLLVQQQFVSAKEEIGDQFLLEVQNFRKEFQKGNQNLQEEFRKGESRRNSRMQSLEISYQQLLEKMEILESIDGKIESKAKEQVDQLRLEFEARLREVEEQASQALGLAQKNEQDLKKFNRYFNKQMKQFQKSFDQAIVGRASEEEFRQLLQNFLEFKKLSEEKDVSFQERIQNLESGIEEQVRVQVQKFQTTFFQSQEKDIEQMVSFQQKLESLSTVVKGIGGVVEEKVSERMQLILEKVAFLEKNMEEKILELRKELMDEIQRVDREKVSHEQLEQEVSPLRIKVELLESFYGKMKSVPEEVLELRERVEQLSSGGSRDLGDFQEGILKSQQRLLMMVEEFIPRLSALKRQGISDSENMMKEFMEQMSIFLGGRGDFGKLIESFSKEELEDLLYFMNHVQTSVARAGRLTDPWMKEEGEMKVMGAGQDMPGQLVQSVFFSLAKIFSQVSQNSFSKEILEDCSDSDKDVGEVIEERLQKLKKVREHIQSCMEVDVREARGKHLNLQRIKEMKDNLCRSIIQKIGVTEAAFRKMQEEIQGFPEDFFGEQDGVFDLEEDHRQEGVEAIVKYEDALRIFNQNLHSSTNPDYDSLLLFALEQKERKKFYEKHIFSSKEEQNFPEWMGEKTKALIRESQQHLSPSEVKGSLEVMKGVRSQLEVPFISRWEILTDSTIAFKIEPIIRALASGDPGSRSAALVLHGRLQRDLWDQGKRKYLPPMEEIILLALQDLHTPNSWMLRDRMGKKGSEKAESWQQCLFLPKAYECRAKMINECETALNCLLGNPGQLQRLKAVQEAYQEKIEKMTPHQEMLKAFFRGKIFSQWGADENFVLGCSIGGYRTEGEKAKKGNWTFESDGKQVICHRGNLEEMFIVHPAALFSTEVPPGKIPLLNLSTREMFYLEEALGEEMQLVPVLGFISLSEGGVPALSQGDLERPPKTFHSRFKRQAPMEKKISEEPFPFQDPEFFGGEEEVLLGRIKYNKEKKEQYSTRVVPNLQVIDQCIPWKQWTEKSIEKHVNMLIYERERWRSRIAYMQRQEDGERLVNEDGSLNFREFILPSQEEGFNSEYRKYVQKYLEHEHRIRAYERVLQRMRNMSITIENCQEITDALGTIETNSLSMDLAENRMALFYQSITGNTLTGEQIDYLGQAQKLIRAGRGQEAAAMLILAGTGFGKTEIMNLLAMLFLANGRKPICCSTVSSNMGNLINRMTPLGQAMGQLPRLLDFESLSPLNVKSGLRVEEFSNILENSDIVCISDRGRAILAYLALHHHDREVRELWSPLYGKILGTQQVCDEVDSQCMSLEEEEDEVLAEILGPFDDAPLQEINGAFVKELKLTGMLSFKRSPVGCSATCTFQIGMALARVTSKKELEQCSRRNVLTGEHRVEDWIVNQSDLVQGTFNVENILNQAEQHRKGESYDVLLMDNNNEISKIEQEDNTERKKREYNKKKINAANNLFFALREKERGSREVWFQLKSLERAEKDWYKIDDQTGEAKLVTAADKERAKESKGRGISYFYSKDDSVGTHSEQSGINKEEHYMGHLAIADLRNPVGGLHPFLKVQQLIGRANRDKYRRQCLLLFNNGEDAKGTLQGLRESQKLLEEKNKPLIFRCHMRGVLQSMALSTKAKIEEALRGGRNRDREGQLRTKVIEDLLLLENVLLERQASLRMRSGERLNAILSVRMFRGRNGISQKDHYGAEFGNTVNLDRLSRRILNMPLPTLSQTFRYSQEQRRNFAMGVRNMRNRIQEGMSYDQMIQMLGNPREGNCLHGALINYQENRQEERDRAMRQLEREKINLWLRTEDEFRRDFLSLQEISKELREKGEIQKVRGEEIIQEVVEGDSLQGEAVIGEGMAAFGRRIIGVH